MMRSPTPHPTHRQTVWRCTAVLGLLPALALAQSGQGGALSVNSSLSATQTITDNSTLSSHDKVADAITQLTASLRLSSRTGRIQGALDYTLNGYIYGRSGSSNNLQNSLGANFVADVIDNWFSITGSAQIAQQSVSAFGTQSIDPGLAGKNGNRTEVRTAQLSPAVRGRFGDLAAYSAQVTTGVTRSGAADARGDSDFNSTGLTLGSLPGDRVSWSASANHAHTDYGGGLTTNFDAIRLTSGYGLGNDLRFSGSVGREWTDMIGGRRTATATWGLGANWSPGPRTRVSAQFDHRFFGNGYSLSLEHRLARSMLRISSSRDVSDPSAGAASRPLGTAYDLFYSQFASVEPDPAKRDQLVRSFLQGQGISPGAALYPGLLASRPMLQRMTEVAYVLEGVRSSLTLSAGLTTSGSLDPATTAADDLAEADSIRQRRLAMTLGHRLTPTTGLSLELSRQSTAGSASSQSNTLRSARLSLTTSLGQRSSASLTARHAVFDSSTAPYTENALIATFGLRF